MKFPQNNRRGFSMIEVSLALGIISFGLVILLALLPVGLKALRNASAKTEAANLLSSVVGDLRAAQTGGSNITYSPLYRIQIPPQGGSQTNTTKFVSATGEVSDTAVGSMFRIYTEIRPTATGNLSATPGYVRISWPGQANPGNGTVPDGAVEAAFFLNRF